MLFPLATLNESFWHKLPWALGIALLIALLIVYCSADAADSALLRGDFPAFYSLGRIALSGDFSKLYDLELQANIQNQSWPSLAGAQLVASYPPLVALLMVPLALLPAQIAKFCFTILSLLSLWLSFRLFRSSGSQTSEGLGLKFIIALFFPPLFIAVLGGQVSAFIILILSLCVFLMMRGRKGLSQNKVGFLIGLVASLSLLKPQFALLVGLYFIVASSIGPCLGFICGGLTQYLIGASMLGFGWPIHWLEHLKFFAAQNNQLNLSQQTSLFSLIDFIFESSPSSAVYQISLYAITFLLSIFLLLILLRENYMDTKEDEADGGAVGSELSPSAFLKVLCLLPLLSPQSSFYDLSISFFFLSVLQGYCSKGSSSWLIGTLNYIALALMVSSREWMLIYTAFPVFVIPALIYAGIACSMFLQTKRLS